MSAKSRLIDPSLENWAKQRHCCLARRIPIGLRLGDNGLFALDIELSENLVLILWSAKPGRWRISLWDNCASCDAIVARIIVNDKNFRQLLADALIRGGFGDIYDDTGEWRQ
jgi:hypothetical protein